MYPLKISANAGIQGKHWIPDQVRNDKLNRTSAVMCITEVYRPSSIGFWRVYVGIFPCFLRARPGSFFVSSIFSALMILLRVSFG